MITLPEGLQSALDSGSTVVVPDRQRAFALRRAHGLAHALRGERAWPSPDVLPFDAWLLREIERLSLEDEAIPRVLSGNEERWLWRRLAEESPGGLAASATLARALRQSDRLAFEHGIDVAAWALAGSAETQWFVARQREMRALERELNAAPVPRIAHAHDVLGDRGPVYFALDARLAPRARAIHERRRSLGLASEWHVPVDRAPGRESMVEAASGRDEDEWIAAWCRSQLDRGEGRELRIVCLGPSERRVSLASLIGAALDPTARLQFDEPGVVTIEGGTPLQRRLRIRASLNALAWLVAGLEFADFSAWLRGACSPLSPPDAARIDLWWRAQGPDHCRAREDLELLRAAERAGIAGAGTLAAKAIDALAELGNERADARRWSEAFRRAVDLFVPPPPPDAPPAQFQELARWIELLEEFGALRDVAGRLGAGQALSALRELAAQASWEPSAGTAAITMAADAGDPLVGYDAMHVCGLDAERWPAPAVPDPFIPASALRTAGVARSSADGQWQLARHQWMSWRRATPELSLSVALSDGDQVREASALLAGVAREKGNAATSRGGPWVPAPMRRWRQGGPLERLVDVTGIPWDAAQALPGGATSLQLQNACPFHAYAQLRLGAEQFEERVPGIGPDERGRWLHRALELFWKQVGDQATLRAMGPDEWARLARAAANGAIELRSPASPARREAARRERERLERLIVQLARLECERAPFEVIGIESERVLELGEARLQLRIDRIDQLADGSLAVLDYKSGRKSSAGWFDERAEPTQLFAYLASLGPQVSLLARVFASTPSPKFQGHSREAKQIPGVKAVAAWEAIAQGWVAHVARLAAAFLEGRADVDPTDEACLHCHLSALCRIDELALRPAEPSDD